MNFFQENKTIRPAHKALIEKAMVEKGFDPSEFTWSECSSDYSGDTVIISKVSHEKSDGFFTFDFFGPNGKWSQRKPGRDSLIESKNFTKWEEQYDYVTEWLKCLAEDLGRLPLKSISSSAIKLGTVSPINMEFNVKPKLFIGSSKEGLSIARAIKAELDEDAFVWIWNQEVFNLSSTVLDDLREQLDSADFGVFVLSPDDITKIRNKDHITARDNVIFELGMFIGRLGKERSFFFRPNNVEDFRLPSDLAGFTAGLYNSDYAKQNAQAAVGTACNKVRSMIQKLGSVHGIDEDTIVSKIADWINAQSKRYDFAKGACVDYNEIDKELSFKAGTAAKYTEFAINRTGYKAGEKYLHGIIVTLFRFS